jgi:NAD-dependent deacetylase sirtuin 2
MATARSVGKKSKRPSAFADSLDCIALRLSTADPRPRVCVLLGAGASVAAGIPDFRSPGGAYASLRPELLTATAAQRKKMRQDPTHVVSLALFQKNPLPFLELLRPLLLGVADQKWRPTLTHRFIQVLFEKGMNI